MFHWFSCCSSRIRNLPCVFFLSEVHLSSWVYWVCWYTTESLAILSWRYSHLSFQLSRVSLSLGRFKVLLMSHSIYLYRGVFYLLFLADSLRSQVTAANLPFVLYFVLIWSYWSGTIYSYEILVWPSCQETCQARRNASLAFDVSNFVYSFFCWRRFSASVLSPSSLDFRFLYFETSRCIPGSYTSTWAYPQRFAIWASSSGSTFHCAASILSISPFETSAHLPISMFDLFCCLFLLCFWTFAKYFGDSLTNWEACLPSFSTNSCCIVSCHSYRDRGQLDSCWYRKVLVVAMSWVQG